MDPITRMVAAGAAGAVGGGDPTYVDDVFSTTLYTSNASSNFDGTEKVITTGIDHTEGFLTWIKNRDDNYTDHVLFDSERIGTNYKWIYSNDNKEEQDTADIFKSPTSTGFTVKQATSGSGTGRTNPSGSKKMVSWTFRKAPKFFDVQTFTASPGTNTIDHSLGSTPGMMIIKTTSLAENWYVWHRSIPNNALSLNSTNATGTYLAQYVWGNASSVVQPTSTQFTMYNANSTNQTYVVYLFAHDDQSFGTNSDQAIIKCGTYTGNGQASGTAVDLGFEPQWVMVKASLGTESSNWVIQNTMTGMSSNSSGNGETVGNGISPNIDGNESGFSPNILATSTGFKALNTSNYTNGNGVTYIYMAIRRPHKPPTAGTDVFALDATSASGSTGNAFDAPFAVDMEWHQHWGANVDKYVGIRLTPGEYLVANSNAAPASGSAMTFDSSDGVLTAFSHAGYSAQMFKRAPGFFDLVRYSGNNSNQLISHNLEAIPELIIIKNRTSIGEWVIYESSIFTAQYSGTTTDTGYINFSSGGASFNPLDNVWPWNSTAPTSSTFSVGYSSNIGSDYQTNESSKNYIALLFASQPGVSKVGSYSGTGSTINVDCGFTTGARFVLIKRTDSGGHWHLWDTAHGITSGNDPYLLLSENQDEVTGTDYIDPLNAGFTVTSSAPAALNESGGTYMFLAIA